jgi:hypothetical protein
MNDHSFQQLIETLVAQPLAARRYGRTGLVWTRDDGETGPVVDVQTRIEDPGAGVSLPATRFTLNWGIHVPGFARHAFGNDPDRVRGIGRCALLGRIGGFRQTNQVSDVWWAVDQTGLHRRLPAGEPENERADAELAALVAAMADFLDEPHPIGWIIEILQTLDLGSGRMGKIPGGPSLVGTPALRGTSTLDVLRSMA